jgi:hypothetical protein
MVIQKKMGQNYHLPKIDGVREKNNIKKCGINPGWLSLMGKM